MTLCPLCGRHLLSQASARCNWCGATINDAGYQAHAQTEREAYSRHTAARDAQSLAAVEALLVLSTPRDPFTHAPIIAAQAASMVMPAQHSTTAGEPIKNEALAAGERFRHLEL